MKKIIALVTLTAALAAVFCGAVLAADWDAFVAQMESREKIKSEGPAFLERIALLAPEGSERELWELSCSAPSLMFRSTNSSKEIWKP